MIIPFLGIVFWLIVAHFVVDLLVDAYYAVQGKTSPRMQEQARRRKLQTQPGTAMDVRDRTRSAIGDYVAGLVEDATTAARKNRRLRAARKRGAQGIDGVFVDLDEDGMFYADCDQCVWTSRPYRMEANAAEAAADHAATHDGPRQDDPDDGTDQAAGADQDTDFVPECDRAGCSWTSRPYRSLEQARAVADAHASTHREADRNATGPAGDTGDVDEDAPRPWKPVIIPGGAADTAPSPQTPAPDPAAGRDPGQHPEAVAPQQPEPFPDEDMDRFRAEAQRTRESGFELFGRCRYPVDGAEFGMCGEPVQAVPDPANPHCGYHTDVVAQRGSTTEDSTGELSTRCGDPACLCADGGFACVDSPAFLADCVPSSHSSAGLRASSDFPSTSSKENSVNTEAIGPDQIRDGFSSGAASGEDRADELDAVAASIHEIADRYASLQMHASTVALVHEAAAKYSSAAADLRAAAEDLQAALSDFNAKDGQVADTAAEVGNLADKEVLVD